MTRKGVRRQSDYFSKLAKQKGYRSRAAFKLLQIQRKFNIFKPGNVVLDLCGSPGGFSQIARQFIGQSGIVLLVDIEQLENLPGVHYILGDITKKETTDHILKVVHSLRSERKSRIDVVLSDCSPKTSGAWSTDHARQIWLSENALRIALELKTSIFICKVFQGDLFQDFFSKVKSNFGETRIFKPQASRKKSAEVYIVSLAN